MITNERLAEIKARHAAASAGTWFADAYDPFMVSTERGKDVADTQFCQNPQTGLANATFIAHARQDVPDLVAEVERLREALGRFARYFIAAADDADYLLSESEFATFETARDALIAVVFNDDGEDFMQQVARARAALSEGGE